MDIDLGGHLDTALLVEGGLVWIHPSVGNWHAAAVVAVAVVDIVADSRREGHGVVRDTAMEEAVFDSA